MSLRQKNEVCFSDAFSVCLKHIGLLFTVLLILTATTFAAPLLKQGSEGHDVLVLQQNLKKLGYPVEPDGVFGTTTYEAVIAFQRDEDLSPTGTVDRATWHALQSRAAQKKETESAEQGPPPAAQDIPPVPEPAEQPLTTQNTPPVPETAEPPAAQDTPSVPEPAEPPTAQDTLPAPEPAEPSAAQDTPPEPEPAEPPTAQNTHPAPESAELPPEPETPVAADVKDFPNETAPIQESGPMEQETKSTAGPNPRPSTLPAPKKTPRQIPQTPVPEATQPKSNTQAPPSKTEPAPKPPAQSSPASKKGKTKDEPKETDTPPNAEKVPEQAPFLPKGKVDAIIKTAKKYIGTRYIFGGTTPKGFDCSGFVQYVFKQNGFSLPRTADEQYTLGKRVKKRAELEPGDLVFFSTYEKGASHCGIYLGKNQFIHVSSSKGVRVDSLDNSYWKPRWYGGKHIVK